MECFQLLIIRCKCGSKFSRNHKSRKEFGNVIAVFFHFFVFHNLLKNYFWILSLLHKVIKFLKEFILPRKRNKKRDFLRLFFDKFQDTADVRKDSTNNPLLNIQFFIDSLFLRNRPGSSADKSFFADCFPSFFANVRTEWTEHNKLCL